jgi:NADH-ubiquinone oxidoreductase chain 5
MEGPTPVSALLHAATMITAGVFLIIRCSPIFVYAPYTSNFMSIIGVLTALFAATVALFQYDIKKIIAYSTCSQLGYMVFSCGLGQYSISFFHLFNHAFFKALLFIAAGSVIHILNNEQDVRKMGGLGYSFIFIFIINSVGVMALSGSLFISGFYSKDLILETSFINFSVSSLFIY